jgi:hypothetical protein
MLEKVSQVAEHVARSVSRRRFLGRLGAGAMSLAAVAAGLLARPNEAQAARRICGTQSLPECVNRPEGTPCANGAGRCKMYRNTGICGCTAYRG